MMCDYQANSTNSFQSEDAAFINFLREEMNSLKESDGQITTQSVTNNKTSSNENIESKCKTFSGQSNHLENDSHKQSKQFPPLLNFTSVSSCKEDTTFDANINTSSNSQRKRKCQSLNDQRSQSPSGITNILDSDEVSLELARQFYRRQLEVVEEQHKMFIKKMKREEEIMEQHHRMQMSILEKQQQLANTQLEFWAQKKLLDP